MTTLINSELLNGLLILSNKLLNEQIGTNNHIDKYIKPVLAYMTDEWYGLKVKIRDNLLILALRPDTKLKLESVHPVTKQIYFPIGHQNRMFQMQDKLFANYKSKVKDITKETLARAKADSVLKITAQGTTLPLSKEALTEITNSIQFQLDSVDDLSKNTRERILQVMQSKYSSITQLKKTVNRELRLDRDGALKSFHSSVNSLANRVRTGKITTGQFNQSMQDSIAKHYRSMYMEGKNITKLSDLTKADNDFIAAQVKTQIPYLNNFQDSLDFNQAIGDELTGRVNWRAGLYAERGTAMFEAGHIAGMPDDVLIDWVLQPAEHCPTCPIYAGNSPYVKKTLPGFPGEGFHLTRCGTNCRCILQVSELYVSEFGEVPEPESRLVNVTPKLADSAIKPAIVDKMSSSDVGRILADQPLNKNKTVQELQGKWVDSNSFGLIEIPIDSVGIATEVRPGIKSVTKAPIIVDNNINQVGRVRSVFGTHGVPPDVLVLDGKHRWSEAVERGENRIMAYVGNNARTKIDIAVSRYNDYVVRAKLAIDAYMENPNGSTLLYMRVALGKGKEDIVKKLRTARKKSKVIPTNILNQLKPIDNVKSKK